MRKFEMCGGCKERKQLFDNEEEKKRRKAHKTWLEKAKNRKWILLPGKKGDCPYCGESFGSRCSTTGAIHCYGCQSTIWEDQDVSGVEILGNKERDIRLYGSVDAAEKRREELRSK